MIACFDVDYQENKAHAACLVFSDWKAASAIKQYTSTIEPIAAYISGEFYKRELPCIMQVLTLIQEPIDYIILDSYVYLNSQGKAGLGAYLYDALNQQTPIIGVAKNAFKEENNLAIPILRGDSQKPLYVTSVGVDNQQAANWIKQMHGEYRMPSLLKAVDQLARS